ncbi:MULTISPECIES: hypothetical protein [unclassified Legionella]|uniref:hypothetical protein n=1 Tax=unclassified Legionella TaxID=2622702 RepID=UPI001E563BE0|nr:hypothetical protein [Legionella sp. 31fI33]MCC5013649.1 hypothetical protein [Legionella sp. 31fI33]
MPKNPGFFDKLWQGAKDVKVVSSQKTPDAKKNFLQNYSDHLDQLEIDAKKIWEKTKNKGSFEEAFNFIKDEATKRMNFLEGFRDRYDFADEVVGATAIPALGMVASVAALGYAIWEGAQALAIHAGFAKDDGKEHGENAAIGLMVSAASFVGAVASFLKSAVSLITRSVATAINGYGESKETRFHNEDSVLGTGSAFNGPK